MWVWLVLLILLQTMWNSSAIFFLFQYAVLENEWEIPVQIIVVYNYSETIMCVLQIAIITLYFS